MRSRTCARRGLDGRGFGRFLSASGKNAAAKEAAKNGQRERRRSRFRPRPLLGPSIGGHLSRRSRCHVSVDYRLLPRRLQWSLGGPRSTRPAEGVHSRAAPKIALHHPACRLRMMRFEPWRLLGIGFGRGAGGGVWAGWLCWGTVTGALADSSRSPAEQPPAKALADELPRIPPTEPAKA